MHELGHYFGMTEEQLSRMLKNDSQSTG
jgi:predicted Zn-dependent protease with MMP-like domain